MPRKILLLVSSMQSGGTERVAANLVNAWSARGDSVTLLVTYSGRGECVYPLSNKVSLIYLADLAGQVGRGFMFYWPRFRALRKLIRDSKPDVVVSFLSNVNIAAILATSGLPCRVIASERTFPPMVLIGRLSEVLRAITYPKALRIVMLTHEGLRWLESHIPKAKGVVIPNPVSLPLPKGGPTFVPEHFVATDRKLLLAVGRLDEGKQFDLLLRAFATLISRFTLWDLVILGEGQNRPQLEKQIANHGLKQRVLLPGRVGNLGDWYSRADLYVMSSRFEGFPNTLAEAMAHGCAVVSYDCDTGPRDIIRHEVDGLLVTPVGDVPALARALDRLMADELERERMSTRAVDVRERFSMQRVLAMWDTTFEINK